MLLTVLVALPAAVWVLKRYELTFSRALLWGVLLGNIPSALGTMVTGMGYGIKGLVRIVPRGHSLEWLGLLRSGGYGCLAGRL